MAYDNFLRFFQRLPAALQAAWRGDEVISVEPNLDIWVFNAQGTELLDTIRTHNLLVKTGRIKLRDLIGYPSLGGDGFTPAYFALGTSSSAVADSNETLGTEVFRTAFSRRLPDGDNAIYFRTYVDSTQANGNTLREAGIFSTQALGTLWTRALFTEIVKTISISVTFSWRWRFVST